MTLDTLRLTIDHGQHEEATHATGNHPGEEVLHWPPCHPLQLTQALQLQHRHRAAAVQTQHETITWTRGRERRKNKKQNKKKSLLYNYLLQQWDFYPTIIYYIMYIFTISYLFNHTHTRAHSSSLTSQLTFTPTVRHHQTS